MKKIKNKNRQKYNILERASNEKNDEKIPRPDLVGSQSLLTIQEEENLMNFIKTRNDS